LGLLAACNGNDPNPEPAPLPFLAVQNATVNEGDAEGTLAFEVRLSAATEAEVSFLYSTVDNDAKAGEDYEAIENGAGSIPAGSTTTTVEVVVLGDTTFEGDETFELVVSDLVGAQASDLRATATLRNDDERSTSDEDVGYRTPESYPGYSLVWQDEFDDARLSSNWTYEQGDGCDQGICGWGNNELQTYTDRPENLYFADGKLVIEARKERFDGASYTSARIVTQGKQDFQYGRIDIRAKLPYGQGVWPALWMLGKNISDVGWPACGEIDIMELVGHEPNVVHGTAHWADDNNNGQRALSGGSYTLADGIFNDEYHVFTILWEEKEIRWLVDDVPYYTINTVSSNLDEFRNDFFFIFNIAVGGDWPGNPNATTVFPQRMRVDYLRVFQSE